MKQILTLTALLAAAATASAQGTVNFANGSATRVATNALGGGPSTGFITGPVGSYYFALLVAPSTQTTVNFSFTGWTFTGNYATNTQSAGRFNGNPTTDGVPIIGYSAGSTANFVVVGWSSDLGHDWGTVAPVLAQGAWFTGYAGMSSIAQNVVLGGGAMYPPTPLSSGFTLSPGCLGPYFEYFTWQPTNQTVNLGGTARFDVGAVACPAPASYQWFFNGTLISGAGQSVYQIPNVQSADAGDYSAVLYNPAWAQCCGYNAYHTSAVATLTVLTQPIITSQPQSQTAYVGTAVDLQIVAAGPGPLSYQWLFNGTPKPGATNADLHLTNVSFSASGSYVAVVTNAFGAVTSAPAVLTISSRPRNFLTGTLVGWGDTFIPYISPGTRFTAIAAGSEHSLAIKADGTVVGWGLNSSGQSAAPVGLISVIGIAGGGNGVGGHSLALKSDGTVVGWGYYSYGYPASAPQGLSGVVGIAEGGYHGLALKSDGTVAAWGSNSYGQTNVPEGLAGVVAIAAGLYHSSALKADGTVVAWGDNGWGQTNPPPGLAGVIAIAAGDLHNLALKSDGTVVAWGASGDQTNVPAGLTGVVAVAARGYNSLALKSDGTVVGWGATAPPAGLSNIVAIAAGEEHELALKMDGSIVAWGSNGYAQSLVPGTLQDITAVSTGGWGTDNGLALRSDSSVFAWGKFGYQGSLMPTNLDGITAIAAGEGHALALKANGAVVVWGDLSQTNLPWNLTNALAVAAGGHHSLAVRSDRTVVAWGQNGYNQCAVPYGLSGAVAVAAGEYHSLALKSDGTVVAWGSNNDNSGGYAGQSVAPTGLSGVAAIAAGGFHSVALKSDGTVVTWGNDAFGQTEVPNGLSGVIGITAGQYHTLALKSDGTIVAWGYRYYGSVPNGLPPAIGVAAGGYHSVALIAQAPVLVTFPASQTAEAGSSVQLRASASGYPPLGYQWVFNSQIVATGTRDKDTLLLPSVQPVHTGSYTIVFSNIFGADTSAPVMLNVIPPVPRRLVPGVSLMAQAGSFLGLEYRDNLGPTANWVTMATMTPTAPSRYYFDVSEPLPPQRFYRAWRSGNPGVVPSLSLLGMVPAITLTGNIGDTFRLDCINQFGPTDAWVTLGTVTLTNTSQLYFDKSVIGQPPRLWRIVPAP